jgi:ABC-2 type transport system ATP-binding protein
MGVIGPHSSGKSQLLSCIAGDWKPRGCKISVQGKSLGEARSRVTYVPPLPGIFPEMTPWEFLNFFAQSYDVSPHYRPYLIWEALQIVGLSPQSHVTLAGLSHSDRYRVSLARAMVSHPAVVVVQGLLDRVESDLVGEFVQILQRMRQTGASLVVSALSLGHLMGLCSHLCVLVTDRPLICGEISSLLPNLVHLKMMQVQFLSGFSHAIRMLERSEGVFHLSVSTVTHNLVRFLFDGQHRPFSELLDELQKNGCLIVSVAEDQSFLGRLQI